MSQEPGITDEAQQGSEQGSSLRATQQLIGQVQAQYEKKLKDMRKVQEQLEEEFDRMERESRRR